MSGLPAPALLVSIDTEGDNQWDVASRTHQTFNNIHALERLHDFFARHGVRPTYVVTHPVARDPRSIDVLRRIVSRAATRKSAHITTPGKRRQSNRATSERHPYALSLPLERFDAQLASLTTAITDAVGAARPSPTDRDDLASAPRTSRRSNAAATESNPASRRSFTKRTKAARTSSARRFVPYFLAYDDATRPGTSDLLELPISAALNRRMPSWLERWYGRAPWPYKTRRALRLARVAHVRWLRPSWSSAVDMNALARQLVRQHVPLLNLFFHSSEAIVGGSPYNRTEADLDAFFDEARRIPRLRRRRTSAPFR